MTHSPEARDQGRPVFLISDAHLGADEAEIEEEKQRRLLAFFDHVRHRGGRLMILGDLFDFWFEYRRMIDAAHFPVLAGLWALRRSGIRIDYHLGNHDYWTSGFLSRSLKVNVHAVPTCESFGRKKALLAHGDGLSGDERGYLFLKKILRSPASIVLFRILHPDAGAWIARRTSRASRKRTREQLERVACRLREHAREKLLAGTYDWIIAGHSHRPEMSEMGRGIYLNIGDWSEHFTYGEILGEEIRLESWAS